MSLVAPWDRTTAANYPKPRGRQKLTGLMDQKLKMAQRDQLAKENVPLYQSEKPDGYGERKPSQEKTSRRYSRKSSQAPSVSVYSQPQTPYDLLKQSLVLHHSSVEIKKYNEDLESDLKKARPKIRMDQKRNNLKRNEQVVKSRESHDLNRPKDESKRHSVESRNKRYSVESKEPQETKRYSVESKESRKRYSVESKESKRNSVQSKRYSVESHESKRYNVESHESKRNSSKRFSSDMKDLQKKLRMESRDHKETHRSRSNSHSSNYSVDDPNNGFNDYQSNDSHRRIPKRKQSNSRHSKSDTSYSNPKEQQPINIDDQVIPTRRTQNPFGNNPMSDPFGNSDPMSDPFGSADPMSDPFGGPPVVNRVPCPHCNRQFAEDRISKHIKVCTAGKKSKRKIFNAAQRRTDREAQNLAKEGIREIKKIEKKKKLQVMPKWKRDHLQFQQILKAGKPDSGPSTNIYSQQSSNEYLESIDDRVECPHCSRKFNPTTAERHIPKCKNTSNKPRTLRRGDGLAGGATGTWKNNTISKQTRRMKY